VDHNYHAINRLHVHHTFGKQILDLIKFSRSFFHNSKKAEIRRGIQ